MTPLNTIIEEEKNEVTKQLDLTLPPTHEVITGGHFLDVQKAMHALLTTAIQRAVEYERARIRESFDDWFKNGTQDVEDWADRNLPTNQGQTSR